MAKYFVWFFVLTAPGVLWGKVRIPSLPGYEEGGSATSSGQRPVMVEDTRDLTPAVGYTTQSCNKGTYRGNDVSWDFLSQVSGGRIEYDNNVSVNDRGELEGHFHLKNYISACFKPSIITVKRGDNIFVRVENTFFDGKSEYGIDIKANYVNSIDERYEMCLRNKELLTPDGAIDIEKIQDQGLISSVRLPYKNAEKGNAPLKLDKNRSYQIYFSSNSASDYNNNPEDSVDEYPSSSDWICSTFHQLSKDEPLHKGKLDSLAEDVLDICEGDNAGDKIKKVLRFRDSNSLGNFKELSGVLDDILIHALAKEQEKIFEGDSDLMELESKMRELLVASRKRDKRIVDTALGDDARNLGKEYKKVLKDLDKKIYQPSQAMIDRLHEAYKNAASDEERDRIDERLRGLSEIMGKLSERRRDQACRRGPCAFYKQFYIYEGQEQFRKEASNFEEMRLSSVYWGRSSKNVRRPLSPSSARRKVTVGMRKFNRRVDAWGDDASVFEGDSSPIRAQMSRIRNINQRAQKRYEQGPYKGLSFWCRGANTKSCHDQRKRRERIFKRRMDGYGQALQRSQTRLMHYQELAEQYQLRRDYEMEQYYGTGEDDYYGGDSGYYPNDYNFPGFQDQDPYNQYQGPYAPSGYDLAPSYGF